MGEVVPLLSRQAKLQAQPLWLPRYPARTTGGPEGEGRVFWANDFYARSGCTILDERLSFNNEMLALVEPPKGWFFSHYSDNAEEMFTNYYLSLRNELNGKRTVLYFHDAWQPHEAFHTPIDISNLYAFKKAEEELAARFVSTKGNRRFQLDARMVTDYGNKIWEVDDTSESNGYKDMSYFIEKGKVEVVVMLEDHAGEDEMEQGTLVAHNVISGTLVLDKDIEDQIIEMDLVKKRSDIAPDPETFAYNHLLDLEKNILLEFIRVARTSILASHLPEHRDPFAYWDIGKGVPIQHLLQPLIAGFERDLPKLMQQPVIIENLGVFTPS